MKKICILGTEGMLGMELVNNFIYKYKIVGIDKIITKNEKIQFYCLDLLKFEQLEKNISNRKTRCNYKCSSNS